MSKRARSSCAWMKSARGCVLLLGLLSAGSMALADPSESITDPGVSPESAELAKVRHMLDEGQRGSEELEAIKLALDEILAADPLSATAHRQYSRYHIQNSAMSGTDEAAEMAAAEASLDRAVALAPNFIEAFVLRGHLYHLLDRPDEARAALRHAEALGSSGDPWLDLNWAEVLLKDREHETALARCERVLKGVHTRTDVYLSAYSCAIRAQTSLGRMEGADATHRAYIARYPDLSHPYAWHAAFQLCSLDDPDTAIQTASAALEHGDNVGARRTLVASLYRRWSVLVLSGEAEEAATAWDRAVAFGRVDPAELMADRCSGGAIYPILHALRETGRGLVISPMYAVLLAADAAPDAAHGIFGLKVQATARVGGDVFLNSETDYRDQRNISVRFTSKGLSAFRDKFGADPDVFLKDKTITVVGAASRKKIDFTTGGVPTGKFYYQTHIVVSNEDQVRVDDGEATPPPPEEPAIPEAISA